MPSLFEKLFHKANPAHTSSSDTIPVAGKSISAGDTIAADKILKSTVSSPKEKVHIDTPQMIVGLAQSSGVQRESNEDSVFSLNTSILTSEKTINFGLFIVADGMGGHAYGEIASSLAVSHLASYILNNLYLPSITNSNIHQDVSIQEMVRDGVLEAHRVIKQQASDSGTTLTAALIFGDQLTIVHVGDSRAYTIDPEGRLLLLTHDHSLVKRLEEIGQLTSDEASIHPKRNLLYRALGQGDPFEPDITSYQIGRGYELLLCSDGLWGVVPEAEISKIIRSVSEPESVCQALVNAANEAGGPDNISVIIVRLSD